VVLHTWRDWARRMPNTVTSVGRLLRVPPLEEIPEPVRGRKFVVVEAALLLDEGHAAELLRPLRRLGPEMDTFATIPVPALQHLHMYPEHPVPGHGDHLLLRELPAKALDAMLAAAGPDVDSALLSVELRHLGGALGRPDPRGGALPAIEAEFAMFAVGMTMSPEMATAVDAHLALVKRALAPWDAGREYLNFAEHATDPRRLWNPQSYLRLRQVRARYDAHELFLANHPVPAAR
jgi:hypothetical protein